MRASLLALVALPLVALAQDTASSSGAAVEPTPSAAATETTKASSETKSNLSRSTLVITTYVSHSDEGKGATLKSGAATVDPGAAVTAASGATGAGAVTGATNTGAAAITPSSPASLSPTSTGAAASASSTGKKSGAEHMVGFSAGAVLAAVFAAVL